MVFKFIPLLLMILILGCKDPELDSSEEVSSFEGIASVEALSSSSVKVTWDRVDGSSVSGYQVFKMNENTELESIGLVGSNKDNIVIHSLDALTKYRFVVRMITQEGALDENTFFKEVTTLAPGDLNVNPSSLVTTTLSTKFFSVKDGHPPYVFTKVNGEGVLNASTGEFVAPPEPGVTIIRVEDSKGAFAYVEIKTFKPLRVTPNTTQIKYGRKLHLTISGGSAPYTTNISSGTEFGVLDSDKNIVSAGASEGTIIIKVEDANGLVETALINVVESYTPEYMLLTIDSGTCIAEKNRDKIRCWGENAGGKIPDHTNVGDHPNETGDNLPRLEIGSKYNLTKISTGQGITCGLTEEGLVRCIGAASGNGRLGNGSNYNGHNSYKKANSLTPALDFGEGRYAKDLAIGNGWGCVILDNDLMKCWGDGYQGRRGSGDQADLGNQSNEMGDNLPYVNLGTGRTVKSIAVSAVNTCVVLDNDRVKCFGSATSGSLGNSSQTEPLGDSPSETGDSLPYVDLGTGRTVKKITGGSYHYCAILDNDKLKCWGNNSRAQLGLGDKDYRGNEAGEMGDALPYVDVGTGRTVKDVAAGYYTTCAILDNDQLKCWGDRNYTAYGRSGYQGDTPTEMGDGLPYIDLGAGYTAKKIFSGPQALHFCVILNTNETRCFGSNGFGQLALGSSKSWGNKASEVGDQIPLVDLGNSVTAESISIDRYNTCFLLNDKSAKCVGENRSVKASIQLSHQGDDPDELGDKTPEFSVGKPILDVISSRTGAGVITTEGKIRNWGYGSYGRLGYGNGSDVGERIGEVGSALKDVDLGTDKTAKKVVATNENKCAILNDDKVKCYGRGIYGSLGNGPDGSHIGNSTATTGDNMPYVDLGTGRTVVDIAAGTAHYCALLDNEKVKCWGHGGQGRLGLGDGGHRGNQIGEMGDNLPYVDVGTGRSVRSIFVGFSTSCAILDNYSVKCWGYNNVGQLGQGHSNHIGDAAGEMGDSLPAIDFGVSEKPIQIAIGAEAVCVLFESERVRCFGNGNKGILAIGKNPGYWGNAPGEMGEGLEWINFGTGRRATSIVAGKYHFCAILDNAKVKCWGDNEFGSVGIGHTLTWGTHPSHLGDNWPYVDFGRFQ